MVKVSVVVPVYNPGLYIVECVTSLLGQSMPSHEYEVILVNDGSTDGTAKRLDRFASEHANVQAIHIPNSGWPGRPRNVGIDAARGEYVYFVDADDWLGDEALERLYRYAKQVDADVVVGREVGHGKGVSRALFRRNVEDATFDDVPLLDLLTPHKLFRRSLLDEHAIRFPEGKRRLEDHPFVITAYFNARRVSVLADYPCYHWVKREDGGNITDQYAHPRGYYGNLREILDIVDRHTEPGPARNRLYAHWYRSKGLDRLRGRWWAKGPDAHALDVFTEVRRLALERFGPEVDEHLSMKYRVRSRAVKADRPDLVSAQARVEHKLAAELTVHSYERTPDHLRLCLSATLNDSDGQPIRFVRRGDRIMWDPPEPLGTDPSVLPTDLDATEDLRRMSLAVVLRCRETDVEYDVPATVERVLSDGSDRPTIQLLARAEVDLSRVAAGSELGPGQWDLFAHVQGCGWRSLRRISDARRPDVLRHVVQTHTTGLGNLSLRVVDPDAAPPPPPPPPKRARSDPPDWVSSIPRGVLNVLPVGARRAGKRAILRVSRSGR